MLQIFVPAGNSYGPELFDVEKLRGGSAWGAGTFAGPTGARQPTTLELDLAQHQVGCPYEPSARTLTQLQHTQHQQSCPYETSA